MVFNSFEFAVFFLIVFGLYLCLRHRWQNYMLLVASYFFYGFWNWKFLSLIFASTLLDYYCGLAIASAETHRRRKLFLVISMAGNLGMLGFFKYFNFFADSFADMLRVVGLTVQPWALDVLLPVGISFYTFQTMSYTIDIYARRMEPTRRFIDFALFVSFFPQLVAGPIERASNLLPQVLTPRSVNWGRISEGAWLSFWGLYKKVFVADNLARFVDQVYGAPDAHSGPMIVLATYAFAMQIYCDFSGYTDIARGVAKAMGFDIIHNFNLPYFARDPRDFWRRWHISLSEWLRDYLYIPLGGGRGTQRRIAINLLITMVLGGLWHGAAWNFVLWGLFHGLLLIGYRVVHRLKPDDWSPGFWRKLAGLLIMFHWTCLGWLIFRLESIRDLPVIAGRLIGDWSTSGAGAALLALIGYSALVIVMQFAQYFSKDLLVVRRFPLWVRALLYVLMYFSITVGGAFDGRQFIYFQF